MMLHKLTEREFSLLQDASLLPTKYQIGKKMDKWLLHLQRELNPHIKDAIHLAEEVRKSTGKISRGENYHNQAYRVLDFPRIFRRDAMFAFRTVVLWGHPIGFHLILSGTYKEAYQEVILAKKEELGEYVYVAAHPNPWIWESDAEGLMACHSLSSKEWEDHLNTYSFIKLSHFMPLADYEQLTSKGLDIWHKWSSLL